MQKQFNYIYDELVSDSDDIAGIIAYSVYKRQKIEWIKKFKEDHEGRDPTEDELRNFTGISTSPAQLEFYKSEAAFLTQNFLSDVLEEDLIEREASFFRSKVSTELTRIRPSFWRDVFAGAIGALVFVMITGVLYFAVWSLTASPVPIIEQIFDVKIISSSEYNVN